MSEYQKYCHWVDSHNLEAIREQFENREDELWEETRIPCRVLRAFMDIGYVIPRAWEGFCKRRTSWYLSSEKMGKFLVISREPLNFSGLTSPIVIMNSNFRPERLPTYSEISELARSRPFQAAVPRLWNKPDTVEKEFCEKWLERNQINEPFDFEKILMSHSANHANFIDPKFFHDLNGSKIPYSISNSAHVCSSCLEFFNILGSQSPMKYVVPCIGAVQFAKLPINKYLKVITSGET